MGKKMTICEVHRQLRRELGDGASPHALNLLRTAFDFGKKMDNKLRQYKHNWSKGWWEDNRLDGGEIDGTDNRLDVGFEEEIDDASLNRQG